MSNWLKSSDQVWWYNPTSEERKNIRPVLWKLKISWDWVFHTIQWEGDLAWRPTTFVRLHFCNLNCSRCDAWYTWRSDTKEYYSEPKNLAIEELLFEIMEAQKQKWLNHICHNITFTGWEPLIQQRLIEQFLTNEIDINERVIQVETNGTLMPTDYIFEHCKFNCSPKLNVSGNEYRKRYSEKVLMKLAEKKDSIFKFVFREIKDIDEVFELYPFLPKEQIRFMPEWVTKEENTQVFEGTIDYILSTWCNVAIRGQNVMRDGAIRWV